MKRGPPILVKSIDIRACLKQQLQNMSLRKDSRRIGMQEPLTPEDEEKLLYNIPVLTGDGSLPQHAMVSLPKLHRR